MNNPQTNCTISIASISYAEDSTTITYTFLVNGTQLEFTGKMHEDPNIRGVAYSEELDEFVLSVMPFDQKISKKLFSISWAYVDGNRIEFPVTLLPPNADWLMK